MNKKPILYLLLDLVFLVVFNTVFFVVGGTAHPASVWLSYAFIHIAYVMVLATPLLTRKSKNTAVLGFPLYTVSAVYFLVEFAIGLLFVLIRSESYKAALVVQIVVAGIYAVLLLTNMIANEHTADDVEQHEKEVWFIKDTSSRVKLLLDKPTDKAANKAIEAVYDLLHSSPSKSHYSVEVLETDIKNLITELEKAVSIDATDDILSTTQKLLSATEERNRRLKTV